MRVLADSVLRAAYLRELSHFETFFSTCELTSASYESANMSKDELAVGIDAGVNTGALVPVSHLTREA